MLKESQWKSVQIHFETILKFTNVSGSLQQFNQVFPSRKANTIERPKLKSKLLVNSLQLGMALALLFC